MCVFPDAVEHDDGVVERIPDHHQDGGDEGEGNLRVSDGKHSRGQYGVMDKSGDGSNPVRQLEPECHVNNDGDPGEDNCHKGFLGEFRTHLGTDPLLFLQGKRVVRILLFERRLDLIGNETPLGFFSDRDLDFVFLERPDSFYFRRPEAESIDDFTYFPDVALDGPLEFEKGERSTDKINGKVEAPMIDD